MFILKIKKNYKLKNQKTALSASIILKIKNFASLRKHHHAIDEWILTKMSYIKLPEDHERNAFLLYCIMIKINMNFLPTFAFAKFRYDDIARAKFSSKFVISGIVSTMQRCVINSISKNKH